MKERKTIYKWWFVWDYDKKERKIRIKGRIDYLENERMLRE